MEGWGVEYFERLLSPSGALQAVLLAAGIYFFLSFLSTSRGSGLFRGLIVAVAVIGLGLLGAAKAFEMGELEHILTENYGSVVLILVILFQPELRRGVARLEHREGLGHPGLALHEVREQARGDLRVLRGDIKEVLSQKIDEARKHGKGCKAFFV